MPGTKLIEPELPKDIERLIAKAEQVEIPEPYAKNQNHKYLFDMGKRAAINAIKQASLESDNGES